ncbi:MAG: hypothetical protein EPO35_06960 [Acidobacteria bacterium]|nr:MAG: hypothetical protein EPO35_06960 [Acidobacteriota bacterium]
MADTNAQVRAPRSLSQQAHRRLIGVLGLLLPFLLYVLSASRPTAGLPAWDVLPSVSAYYYTGAVGIFVGVLFALSLFLFTYQGYQGERADRVLGAIGGASALGVALFPTRVPPTQPADRIAAPTWWTEAFHDIHLASAVALFIVFILFAVWLFRKSAVPRADRPTDKVWRDRFCLGCGVVMIVAVVWAVAANVAERSIFWQEGAAIMAFALSWLAKGEAYQPIVSAARSVRRFMAR